MPRNAIGKFNRRGADKSDIRETLVEEEQTLIETLPERHTYTDAEIQQALDLNGGDIALAAEAVGGFRGCIFQARQPCLQIHP
jgi:hypothetical protein